MKFTVKRKEWLRGPVKKSGLLTYRINEDGTLGDLGMCCLGFLARECGYSPTEIFEHGDPSDDFECDGHKWPETLVKVEIVYDEEDYYDDSGKECLKTSRLCDQIILLNDSAAHNDKEREAGLKKLFAEAEIEVRFVDE